MSKPTINKYFRSLGWYTKQKKNNRYPQHLTWSQIEQLLGMKLWTTAKNGSNSLKEYICLAEDGLGAFTLKDKYGIDLDLELEKLKQTYHDHTTQFKEKPHPLIPIRV